MKSSTLPFHIFTETEQGQLKLSGFKLTSSFSNSLSKRFFDIAFSLCILSLLFPLFLFIAIAIRLSSPGQAIYTQSRLGKGGSIFKCYKFRSMHRDADAFLEEILEKNPLKRAEWEQNQKLRSDPRVFAFGQFLRKTSLDELPQFWNVLKGDLSVVGPRPYMISQKKNMGRLSKKILSVRPGITGIWQTSGRSSTSFHERLALDAGYVDSTSFWNDLILILKTIPQVLFSKNAC